MASKKTRKCRRCPTLIYPETVTGLCVNCLNKERAAATPSALVNSDRERQQLRFTLSTLQKKYDQSLADNKKLQRELNIATSIEQAGVEPISIVPREPSGTAEGHVIVAASDWHVEERVDPATIHQKNEYNLDIAAKRAERFFQSTLRLTRLLQQDIKVSTMTLALLGDFITNDIHEDAVKVNQLQPIKAVQFAQNLIVGGLEFLLNNSKLRLIVPCHSGNHARTTRKQLFAAEAGHSLEYLMYRHLETYFKGQEDRIEFRVSEGYHSFQNVYNRTVRFHHGHAINYQGGIGGIFIPAFKAISQWDKATRADLDIFGHFHQHKDGGKFVSNGSLIGYSAFGLAIKADYEPPKQTMLLIDKARGRTCTWPVLVEKERGF